MALDYQKIAYQKDQPNKQKRTTYSGMNAWQGVLPDLTYTDVRFLPRTTSCTDCKGAHLQFHHSNGYDDAHRAYLAENYRVNNRSNNYPINLGLYGPPRVRQGRQGGGWRHVTEVMQARGQRLVFVNGGPKTVDNSRLENEEIPNGNIILNSAKIKPHKLTAADMLAIKATESGNWHVMR